MSDDLNTQQMVFCDEYLVDFNATKAYIRAGYSENGARQSAMRLLYDPRIQSYINVRLREMGDRREEMRSALIAQLDEQARMEVDDEDNRYKWAYKIKSQELLGKYLGLFNDKIELTGKNGGPIESKIDMSKLTTEELQAIAAIHERLHPDT